MLEILQFLMPAKLLTILLKPIVRLILGVVAVPLSKLFLHRVVRLKELDAELERDLTLWIRGSLVLLLASSNMESTFFNWVPPELREEKFWLLATRLMLAIGVIEGMPDQALFAIIHPGPPKPKIDWAKPWSSLGQYLPKLLKGVVCQHLNRGSPVLAILTVILPPGPVGWICYGVAIFNYLIIGLVSSRDKAIDVLQQFDKVVAERREEILHELQQHELPELTPEQRLAALKLTQPEEVPAESGTPVSRPVPKSPE